MVDRALIEDQFLQTGNSCVLASYGVANQYFTAQTIPAGFEAYCRHFILPFTNAREAERAYEQHFNRLWQLLRFKGYQIIVNLHQSSSVPLFEIARSRYNAIFFLNSDVNALERRLQAEDALLNVTYEVPGPNFHSVIAGCSQTGFFVRDTNQAGTQTIASLGALGILRDSVLYTRA